MEFGYVSSEGYIVFTPTDGPPVPYRAYHVDLEALKLRFLTFPQDLVPVSEVEASLWRCPDGWIANGPKIVPTQSARLFRTKRSFVLIGGPWKKLRFFAFRNSQNQTMSLPLFARAPIDYKTVQKLLPTRNSLWLAWLSPPNINAGRLQGRDVDLFTTETREFSEFVGVKLLLRLSFPTEGAAKAFASEFPSVADVASLDKHVKVDIDSTTKRPRPEVRTKRSVVAIAVAAIVLVGLGIATIPLLGFGGAATGLRIVPALLAVIVIIGLLQYLYEPGPETRAGEKWQRIGAERWAAQADRMPGAFVYGAKEIGLDLAPDLGSLRPLDDYLRGLRPDAFHPGFAMAAGSYVGSMVLARCGRDFSHSWRYDEARAEPFLYFNDFDIGIFPIDQIRQVWETKDDVNLDQWVDNCVFAIYMGAALRDAALLRFLGFIDDGDNSVSRFKERLGSEFDSEAMEGATSHVIGEMHLRRLCRTYGALSLEYIEIEVEGPRGSQFLPWLATGTLVETPKARGMREPSSLHSPADDEFVVMRFEGTELVPLRAAVTNYLECLGRAVRIGPEDVGLFAVADELQIFSERVRQTRPEHKDSIGPRQLGEGGSPTSPIAHFVGRIDSVDEIINPFSGIALWRIGVKILEFKLQVLVLKNRCPVLPQVGHFASGSVWLGVQIPAEKGSRSPELNYIM